jgi:type IV secretion system protein VirD4
MVSSRVLQVFGTNDHESARMVSNLLGQSTIAFATASQALDSDKSGLSYADHHIGRPLLPPNEVRNLSPDRQLLFLAGTRPILADKPRYYAEPEFPKSF